MLIDWFTVIAQAINFLILVWLLKRFLYQPILNAIDAREKRIADELAAADAKKTEAQKEQADYQGKNEAFDASRAAKTSAMEAQVKTRHQKLLDEARASVDALTAKRQAALREEVRNLSEAMARRTQQEVFAVARKALADLSGADLEQRMAGVFTQRLRGLAGGDKAALAEALKTKTEPVRVRSTFDLSPETQAQIQQALNETFSADLPIQFETSDGLIGGIELVAHGQKVAWSIAGYLETLEKSASDLLEAQDSPKTEPEAQKSPGAKPEEAPS